MPINNKNNRRVIPQPVCPSTGTPPPPFLPGQQKGAAMFYAAQRGSAVANCRDRDPVEGEEKTAAENARWAQLRDTSEWKQLQLRTRACLQVDRGDERYAFVNRKNKIFFSKTKVFSTVRKQVATPRDGWFGRMASLVCPLEACVDVTNHQLPEWENSCGWTWRVGLSGESWCV